LANFYQSANDAKASAVLQAMLDPSITPGELLGQKVEDDNRLLRQHHAARKPFFERKRREFSVKFRHPCEILLICPIIPIVLHFGFSGCLRRNVAGSANVGQPKLSIATRPQPSAAFVVVDGALRSLRHRIYQYPLIVPLSRTPVTTIFQFS
jgi:hypothetical protein